MGCGASKSSTAARNQAEAGRYQRRKKNNFRDTGLQRHMDACQKQKKNLKHVEDPDKNHKKKIEKIQAADKKEAKATGIGLNGNELQKKKKNLKHH